MSMFFINSAHEEDADSPTSGNSGQKNEGSQDPNNRSNEPQGELTLETFWPKVYEEIRRIDTLDVRNQSLPLARIKKIMKLDEDVKMISAEAPVLFAKAAELFIMELTLRAWVHTEDNKRRTLQRSDIAMAITKFDQFDFLIDIVPREDAKDSKYAIPRSSTEEVKTPNSNEQIQYYFQLGNQQGNLAQASTSQAGSSGTIQVIQQSTGQIQTLQLATQGEQGSNVNGENNIVTANPSGTTQIIQMQAAPGHAGNILTTPTSSGGIQLVQQVVTPNGDIQHIPIRIVTTGNR